MDRTNLLSEITEIDSLLEQMPVEQVIDRASLQARRQEVEDKLKRLEEK